MKLYKGFTLIEVIISLAMIGIIAASVLPVIGWLLNRTYKYQADSKVAEELQKQMEVAYNVLLADNLLDPITAWNGYEIGEDYKTVLDEETKVWSLEPGRNSESQKFNTWISLERVCRAADTGSRTDCGSGILDPNSRVISVTVEWKNVVGVPDATAELLVTKL